MAFDQTVWLGEALGAQDIRLIAIWSGRKSIAITQISHFPRRGTLANKRF
jgi:hypothetical protein